MHVSPVVQVYMQSPLPGQSCVHVVLGGQSQIWSEPLSGLHEKPRVGSASAPASVALASEAASFVAASFPPESFAVASLAVASLELPSGPASVPSFEEPQAKSTADAAKRSRFMRGSSHDRSRKATV